MKKYLKPMLVLFISFLLFGCENANGEAKNMDDSDERLSEEIVNDVEAEKEGPVLTETSRDEYIYEDFVGTYAVFEGEPYQSAIIYAIILAEDKYVDIVPEWMEYKVFQIEAFDVEGDVLTLAYESEGSEMQEATAGEMELRLKDEEESSLVIPHNDLVLYPITQEDLLEQGIQIPNEYFK